MSKLRIRPYTLTTAVLILLIILIASPAWAQDTSSTPTATGDTESKPPQEDGADQPSTKKQRKLPPIGVNLGIFTPTSGHSRDTFGGSWTKIGLGVGGVKSALSQGKLSFDLSIYSNKSGDNHAFLAPIGIEYRRALRAFDPTHRPAFIPYAGATLNIVATELCVPTEDIHSRTRFTEGGSIFLGATVGKRVFVEARYLGIGKVRGLDLSGFNFDLGVRL
ncbi:hypothetical protein [Capsulimonas corticalis]|uniref:hypothetical protein n=1 Tax=Capsulimonas corticalis TaxID=2219043 RepID=UPI000F64E6C6|nr:hypothetical protein [Capsulimonas corticalis]